MQAVSYYGPLRKCRLPFHGSQLFPKLAHRPILVRQGLHQLPLPGLHCTHSFLFGSPSSSSGAHVSILQLLLDISQGVSLSLTGRLCSGQLPLHLLTLGPLLPQQGLHLAQLLLQVGYAGLQLLR